ncbi:hypothetical protein HPB50_004497 [Hyalomma asiaticum]|uniref:Uncharacterized protein n=1 Tax=Hyalomma asiaticum TaxID=266040 RepID=A0ACB7TEY8_HYAAI|nr:hypothetical protein HPB50_004497 [Hyalomma asiaticum]
MRPQRGQGDQHGGGTRAPVGWPQKYDGAGHEAARFRRTHGPPPAPRIRHFRSTGRIPRHTPPLLPLIPSQPGARRAEIRIPGALACAPPRVYGGGLPRHSAQPRLPTSRRCPSSIPRGAPGTTHRGWKSSSSGPKYVPPADNQRLAADQRNSSGGRQKERGGRGLDLVVSEGS